MYLIRSLRKLYKLKLRKKEKMHVSAISCTLLIAAITRWKNLAFQVTLTTATCCPLSKRKGVQATKRFGPEIWEEKGSQQCSIIYMSWMTVEIKFRMRAIAPVRSGTTNCRNVNIVGGRVDEERKYWHKCSVFIHPTCQKLAAMNYDERVKRPKLTTSASAAWRNLEKNTSKQIKL
jgi:hypothetical protein